LRKKTIDLIILKRSLKIDFITSKKKELTFEKKKAFSEAYRLPEANYFLLFVHLINIGKKFLNSIFLKFIKKTIQIYNMKLSIIAYTFGIIFLISTTLTLGCLFNECNCKINLDKSYDIICMPTKTKYFPKRNNNASMFSKDLLINLLFITRYEFKSVPDDAFSGLNIKNLILAENQLQSLKANSFRGIKAIRMLRLIERNLKTIEANAFSSLEDKLEDLDLVGIRINDKSKLDIFFNQINTLFSLNKLTLNNLNISSFKADWFPILKNLNHLSLPSNSIKTLNENIFKSSPNLISLDLSNNNLTNLKELFNALKPIEANLKVLKLGGNSIKTLETFPNFTCLEYLDLSNNKIYQVKETAFSYLTRMNYLYLDSNQIVDLPEKVFENSDSLLTLKLAHNKLKQVPKIRRCSRLQLFDLSNNKLKEIKDYAFERSVKLFSSLGVNLQGNDITNFGSRSFCSHYSNVIEIHDLNLSYNTYERMNKCLLKQLNSTMVARIYLRVLPNEFRSRSVVHVCDCSLMRFLDINKINLLGECQEGKDKCTENKFDQNECFSQKEFNC
jgi:hypothetical protein